MKYSEFLSLLHSYQDVAYADFQKKLIFTKQMIIGVRTPVLRQLAKAYKDSFDTIFAYPDEYYEVTFIKLAMVAALPYERFLLFVEACVDKMDNWSTCDCFKAKCIAKNKEAFLPVLEQLFYFHGEYGQRYTLVTLLTYYTEDTYLSVIESYIREADTKMYYIHMAVAWLTAELIVKKYSFGLNLLRKVFLDKKTHNKAIQKAIESYRISQEQKDCLRSLKIK